MFFRILAALLCAVSLTACSSVKTAKAADKPSNVTVVTYNIRAGMGLGKGNDPAVMLDGIAKLLAEKHADVVLLQEVDMGVKRSKGLQEAEVIAKSMGFQYVFAPAIPLGGGNFGIAILSRWPITDTKSVQLYLPDYKKSHPEYPDYYSEQRMALVATVDAPGKPITLIDTHMGLTADQREKQLAQIAEIIDAHKGESVIFGGDLNAKPEEGIVAGPISSRLYNNYLLAADGTVPFTFPADKPDRRIDYIFTSPDLQPLAAEVPETTLSDHRPLLVTLQRK